MTCINCQTESDGTYCPACGQRMEVKRINFKEGWQDFWARIYGFDGMFPRTLRDLTIRPGAAARTFIEGNRVAYYGPVGYFFLMITLFLLVLGMLGLDYADFLRGALKSLPLDNQDTEAIKTAQRFVADNIKLVTFMAIPFQALTARYLVFRKSGYNFLENSVLPFYTMGHLYWVSILGAVYYKLVGTLVHPLIETIVTVLYIGFAYTSFITYQSKRKSFMKGVLLFFISYSMIFIFLAICVSLWILFLAWQDPEGLKMFKPTA